MPSSPRKRGPIGQCTKSVSDTVLVVSDFANAHIDYFAIVFGKPVQRKNETIHLIIRGRDLTFKGRPCLLRFCLEVKPTERQEKDRRFLRVRAAKCPRLRRVSGSVSGASCHTGSCLRLQERPTSGLMANKSCRASRAIRIPPLSRLRGSLRLRLAALPGCLHALAISLRLSRLRPAGERNYGQQRADECASRCHHPNFSATSPRRSASG
jgi:hypothetical protein